MDGGQVTRVHRRVIVRLQYLDCTPSYSGPVASSPSRLRSAASARARCQPALTDHLRPGLWSQEERERPHARVVFGHQACSLSHLRDVVYTARAAARNLILRLPLGWCWCTASGWLAGGRAGRSYRDATTTAGDGEQRERERERGPPAKADAATAAGTVADALPAVTVRRVVGARGPPLGAVPGPRARASAVLCACDMGRGATRASCSCVPGLVCLCPSEDFDRPARISKCVLL